jgi:hypothetical protein
VVDEGRGCKEDFMARKFSLLFFFAGILFMGVLRDQVYAYIDPGSGSYLFQIMLASLVGAAFAVKAYWVKIKDIVKKIFHKDAT